MLITALLLGCTGGEPSSTNLFSSADTSQVVLEVDYMTGVEPWTGQVGTADDVWNLFDVNAAALFEDTPVDHPWTLDDMEEIAALGQESYSRSDILDIADDHRDLESGEGTATFYAVWVDGLYESGGEVQEGVIGVSFGNTAVFAMFGPVLERLGITPMARAFGEQTTLIHEFGHAVGLVNNGVPNIAEHQDAEHGAHCTNDRCVMYWQNEGESALASFVLQYVLTDDAVVFDTDCLDDVDGVRE